MARRYTAERLLGGAIAYDLSGNPIDKRTDNQLPELNLGSTASWVSTTPSGGVLRTGSRNLVDA